MSEQTQLHLSHSNPKPLSIFDKFLYLICMTFYSNPFYNSSWRYTFISMIIQVQKSLFKMTLNIQSKFLSITDLVASQKSLLRAILLLQWTMILHLLRPRFFFYFMNKTASLFLQLMQAWKQSFWTTLRYKKIDKPLKRLRIWSTNTPQYESP